VSSVYTISDFALDGHLSSKPNNYGSLRTLTVFFRENRIKRL